jgi:membrane-anchored protein YejM (alkaline phosphatase superfamily)
MTERLINYEHNTLLITLDSCRYDTFELAHTPNIDKIGEAVPAMTNGNFTLPAHTSIFSGFLPKSDDKNPDSFYTANGVQLWRLNSSKNREGQIGVPLSGRSILEGYRNLGYKIRGFGGTQFFYDDHQILRADFKEGEFQHFGAIYGHEGGTNEDRHPSVLPFSHIDEIAESVKNTKKWFLFINSHETHSPYNVKILEDPELQELVKYSSKFRNGKTDPEMKYDYNNGGYRLHALQVEALEFVDEGLGDLLDKISHDIPILTVITGDHGEAFGENGLWGHIINKPKVLEVPLLINPQYLHKNN